VYCYNCNPPSSTFFFPTFAKNKGNEPMFTLNCKGRLLVIDKPVVMGIINVTPAAERLLKMLYWHKQKK
jgi:hypothetical protein